MRMIFLGTSAAVASAERDNTAILCDDVLIDCPGNVFGKMIRAGYDPLKLQAVIITHRHVDHSYGLPSFLEMLRLSGKKETLKLYVNEDFYFEAKQVLEVYKLVREDFPLEIVPVSGSDSFFIDGLKIETFPVRHSVPNFGLKVSDSKTVVVYSSDTEPCEEVIEQARSADVLIHEATCAEFVTGRKEGHSCIEDAAKIAREARVKVLCLVHFGSELENLVDELKQKVQGIFNGRVVIPQDLDRLVV